MAQATMSKSTDWLAQAHPNLCPTDEDLKHCRNRLERAYGDYTAHVSPANMAMSLESCAYIMWLALQLDVKRAIDFGSGFTSYVLRVVCDDVVSVDDSPEWLAWTHTFLERHNMHHGRLVLWDDFEPADQTEFGLVVYDFSAGNIRDEHFMDAVAAIAPGGVGVMDDAMHVNHQKSMRDAALAFGYEMCGVEDWTRDEYSRYAAIIIRP